MNATRTAEGWSPPAETPQPPKDGGPAAAEWLKRAMLDAMAPMIDPVPVVVDVTINRTWGGEK